MDFRPHERLDAWRAFNSGIYQIEAEPEEQRRLDVKAAAYRVGDCLFGQVRNSGHGLKRSEPTQVLNRPEFLVVRVYDSGSTWGTFNERHVEMTRAHVTVYDYGQAVNARTQGAEFTFFIVPYSAVGYDPSRHPRVFQVATASPSGVILQNNMQMMQELIPTSSVTDANMLVNGFSGLLQAYISQDLREETVQQRFATSREVAVRRFMRENLKNPEMNAELICMTIGVSRAVLYRMFDDQGGVHKTIQRLRLEGAFNELSHTEPVRGAVARVARNWTFTDQAHFSRLFRQVMGHKPSDVLGSGLITEAENLTGYNPNVPGMDFKPAMLIDLYEKLNLGSTR